MLAARHHDGFALWDSPSSYDRFDAVHSAAKRDLIAPYVKAARDAGMRVGLYYSPVEKHDVFDTIVELECEANVER